MACLCPCITIDTNEQAIISNCTTRSLLNGPKCCAFIYPWSSVTKFRKVDVKQNEYILVRNKKDPAQDRYVHGPTLFVLNDPYEEVEFANLWEQKCSACPKLDQDDYITVFNKDGVKKNVRGPLVYLPQLGDVLTEAKNTVTIPMNFYIKVMDSNDSENPIRHIPGPHKFFPEPYQSIIKNGNQDCFPCVEVNKQTAVHLQKADGNVILLDEPQFYMPKVGETVLGNVTKNILITTDFCILKSPDGEVFVMDGRDESNRSFFLKPFYSFVTFECEKTLFILSTLPTFLSHSFNVRTSDNVVLNLELRVSFQIVDVKKFSLNPIQFYQYIKNNVQNDLLDRFSSSTLREFMNKFSKIAQESVQPNSENLQNYGITILDIQIIQYTCVEPKTQELLQQDIHTNVTKQNELRARQSDILIQEQNNEVMRKQKDLEVQMAMKDNQVKLQKKQMDNQVRIKEMEIAIQEEQKRTELLEIRRGNELMEAEYEGRAKGHVFKEFVKGLDENLTMAQKVEVFMRMQDLEQAKKLYSKVSNISMYPPNTDLKLFQFDKDHVNESKAVKDGVMMGLGMKQANH